VISYDEEIGCVGIRDMVPELSKLIGAPRLVIVGESTSMQIATGHKGKAALRITCHGEAGHSALAPRFVNAIHVAARVVEELQGLQARLAQAERDQDYDIPYSTVHVGRIEGGQALNIIPDEARIEMEYRYLPTVSVEKIEAAIVAATETAQAAFPRSRISMAPLASYPGLDTPRDHPAVEWMRGSVDDTVVKKVAFGTEAGFFDHLGLTALVLGPGDMAADGHKPDEGLCLTQLEACDRMLENIREKLSGASF
jgi:acetylornithine deacetylase